MILKEQDNALVYSDGDAVEKQMLEIARQYPEEEASVYISKDSHYTLNNTFSAVRKNILNWYPFHEDAEILEVGAGMGAVTGLLCDRAKSVTAIEMNKARADVIRARYPKRNNLEVISQDFLKWDTKQKFDYIVMIGVLEYAGIFCKEKNAYVQFLSKMRSLLKPSGILLFAIENQYGLKYWIGASEDHLQEPYAGINGYRKSGTAKTFSRESLVDICKQAGLHEQRFYYILPDYKFPTGIFTDEELPNDRDIDNIRFTYSRGSRLTADERRLTKEIIKNGEFTFFANSFLVEAGIDNLPDYHILRVNARSEVYEANRIVSTIDSEGKVYKFAVSPKAQEHIIDTYMIGERLRARGIPYVEQKLENNRIVMPKIDAPLASEVLREAAVNGDEEKVYQMIHLLEKNLLQSSGTGVSVNSVFRDDSRDYRNVLQHGYIDMTFDNAFWIDDQLVFFDQEWDFPGLPSQFILYYAVKQIYRQLSEECGVTWEKIKEKLAISPDMAESFDCAEQFLWKGILTREGDLYGEDNYCNIASPKLELKYIEAQKEKEWIKKISQLQEEKKQLRQTIEELDHKNKTAQENENLLQQRISELKMTIHRQEQYEAKAIELDRIKGSRSWRYMLKIWKVRDLLLPKGSRRRHIAKKIFRTILHPVRTLSGEYREKNSPALVDNPLHGEQISRPVCPEKKKEDYQPFEVKNADTPVVSIVIPVYNQFDYTYRCIRSITQNSGDIPLEIIVADDCSSDLTGELQTIISGIKVIRNQQNLRFLRNCNHAAQFAKGKYLLFLNNDTEVAENWLQPMVDLLEKDETIGMTGAKLVYPDGRLQEAGGIIWADGNGWNYGRLQDPDAPEYNYIKEVDYISGAAIMIRNALWKELGGFDDRFAPAYYEDTDLAFAVRKAGYRVVYQPKSVVTHFEGVSNGTDISSGQKAYQEVNRTKFLKKWGSILQAEQCSGPEELFLARDRSQNKRRLLMVDHYVPMFDKDAGSRAVYSYLRLFIQKGYKITFIGDNFFPHQPYTQTLQQMGIEVIFGDYYYLNWQKWLKEVCHFFDYAFLNRPHITVKYIDLVREYSNAKIIYFGHDLNFLREQREYEVTGNPDFIKSSKDWEKKELALMRKADVSYYPSCVEEELVHKIAPDIQIRAVPLYQYENIQERPYNFEQRKDLMFIGGYNHRPNVDAAKWFATEILPQVIKKIPDIRVHLMGSNAPDEIVSLANENILFEGTVSDEELSYFYSTCRISVVPLRYGAGIKGKVLEALSLGMPVMTTSIGAEGIAGAEEILCVADDADTFAAKLVQLYQDKEDLTRRSVQSFQYIKENFSPENVIRIIGQDFEMN